MIRSRIATLMAICCAAATGCASMGGDNGNLVSVRDSAGVRIVEVQPREWPPPVVWRLSDSPSVNIGVREGNPDYELYQVQGALGLPDGGIVVAEFGARLKYFDAQGRHVRTLELQGQGPGEAEAFMGISRYRGDSLLLVTGIMFSRTSRTSLLLLASDGSFGRTLDFGYGGAVRDDPAWISMNSSDGTPIGLGDGSLVIRGSNRIPAVGAEGAIADAQAALLRVGAQGGVGDTAVLVRSGTYEYRSLPSRKYELMLDEAEPASLRARGNSIYFADGRRFSVDLIEATSAGDGHPQSLSGTLRRSYRIHAPGQAVTLATREAYITTLLDIYEEPDDSAGRLRYRQRLESLRSPDSLPAVQDLQVDADGNVWLESYQPPGSDTRLYARSRGVQVDSVPSPWIVLDPDGNLLGTVLVPAGVQVLEIGSRHLLAMWHDELGVQYIRRYQLLK